MTIISPAAEAARENARTLTGQFGTQEHSVPELTLDSYVYPALKRGLTPAEVDINLWYRENESGELVWHVGAYPAPVGANGFSLGPDTSDSLFPSFEVPFGDDKTQDIDEDHWVSLDDAPEWLRDAVMPSLIDRDDAHDLRKTHDNQAWRKARHDRIIADGGFASAYDNEFIADFEETYPEGTPLDAAAGLFMMSGPDEDDWAADEREAAAAELSRRAAVGMGGALVDARQLRAGDQVSLAHLTEHLPTEVRAHTDYATVTQADASGAEGTLHLRFDNGALLGLPTGSRLPAVSYTYGGREHTAQSLVNDLVSRGEISFRTRNDSLGEIVERFNRERGLAPGDPDFIDVDRPSLTGATL